MIENRIARLAAVIVAVFQVSVSFAAPEKTKLRCHVTVVGGGPAGVYLAYRLAPKYGDKLCLFEKESSIGGRMLDEEIAGVWVGTGARRVNALQPEVLALAKELGLKLETPPERSQLIHSAKRYGFSPDDFVRDFPGLIGPLDHDPKTTREDEIDALLIKKKAKAKQYRDLRSYIKAVAGPQAADYLRTVSRFHADFDYSLSPSNYLDYFEEENELSKTNRYPVGGMSAFLRAMEERAEKNGARFFVGEPAKFFEAEGSGYLLSTPRFDVSTERLVFAIPPSGMDKVSGQLADEIRKAPEYQALFPIPIVIINQAWEKAWWNDIPNVPKKKGSEARIWRAWSSDQCVDHTEIPQEDYLASAHAIRAVYSEDPACVAFWRKLMDEEGIDGVEKEVVTELAHLFDFRRKHEIKIPKPIQTTFHYWPAGWYYVRSGAKVSNAEIAHWAIEPLRGQRNLMLVGEAYWPNRPGWSIGAYRSANALIKARF